MRVRRTAATSVALLLALTVSAPATHAFAPRQDSPPAEDVEAAEDEDALVAADFELIAALGDRTPSHVFRRLANAGHVDVPAGLAAVFADETLAWRTRSLALTAWARHMRTAEDLEEKDEREASIDRLREAISTWLDDTSSPLRRAAAMEAADELGSDGEVLLRAVVDERPDTVDAVRAFELFADDRRLPDYAWFKTVYGRGGKKAPNDEIAAYAPDGALGRMREIAFRETCEEMRGEELEDALEDRSAVIRARANEVQDDRDDVKADERAEEYIEDDDEPIELRRWAASKIADHFDRERYFTYLFEDVGCGKKIDPELRRAISGEINRAMPQRVLDIVRKQLTKGRPPQMLFAIDSLPARVTIARTGRRNGPGGDARDEGEETEADAFGDEKVLEALRANLTEKDRSVRLESLAAMVARNDTGGLSLVQRAARKAKDDEDVAALLRARLALGDAEKDLLEDALELTGSDVIQARRAAISVAGTIDPDGHEELLREALFEGPPTLRRAVLDSATERRWGRGVTLMIEALAIDHLPTRDRALRSLWTLTGKDLGALPADWEEWWSGERGAFEAVDPELARDLRDGWGSALRREDVFGELLGVPLRRANVGVAFDLGIEALGAPAAQRHVGESPAASFVELVRRDLVDLARQAGPIVQLRILPATPESESPWQGLAACGASTASAIDDFFEGFTPVRTASLEELVAGAEADVALESLIVVSTGDRPKFDAEDAEALRRAFTLRNRERDLVVHGVALGAHDRALRWLAESSGGTYVFLP
ncbi:hypothetical protein Pla163_34700 [Planctomycetes bacterium Pla163]|uniref:VWFA domain-containing protein n=1 Tax=Rohdeia mirabilis TaxID=2528008 RepID=A0A518D4C8_9BACT|nr:hypothetical protein Pla163_34700 [Planctomycetes bacterium Pla163]